MISVFWAKNGVILPDLSGERIHNNSIVEIRCTKYSK